MSFKDDISEAKSKELNYFHKANEDFADDVIESNKNCWSCSTAIPVGKKYCEYHCGHPADEFDSFTGKCGSCGKSLNVNIMMAMPIAESKATEAKIERSNGSMTIDGKQVIKIWESMQGWYWYAVEDQGEYIGVGADGNDIQAHAWFGYVQAEFNEWGTFDSKELERAGVWTVPKSNWGWTGRMEESKASEDYPNSGFDWNYLYGEAIFTCKHCNKEVVDDSMEGMKNHLKEHGITGESNSRASEGHIWGDWFSDNFKEVYTMDQSGTYRCKHCDAWFDMYMHSQEVAKYHLAGHGILTESKASEYTLEDLERVGIDWDNSSVAERKQIIIDTHNGYTEGHDDNIVKNWNELSNHTRTIITQGKSNESKASEARKLNARQKKLIEEWVGSMSSPPMVITSDDLPYSLLSELRDINDFDGFESAIMRYASDLGNKQAMQGSNPYMHSSNYGSFESKASEVNGDYIVNGMVIGKVTDFEPNNWFGKVELFSMPEFAEYGDLDPQAVVKGDNGVTYKSPRSGHGTLFDDDGNPTVDVTSFEPKANENIEDNASDILWRYESDVDDYLEIIKGDDVNSMTRDRDSRLRWSDVSRRSAIKMGNRYQKFTGNYPPNWDIIQKSNMDNLVSQATYRSDESKADESEDVFMYDGTGDSDGVGYWWDFVLPIDDIKHEQISSLLGIDINTAWGFMTPAEQDRLSNYKLNKVMSSEDRDWDGRSDLEKLERDQELRKQFWNKSSTLNEIPDSYYKESKASEFTPLELYDTIEPLWNNLSENDRKKIIINTTYGFVGQDNNVKSNWNQIDHMTQQRIADNWDDAFNMIDEDKKTIYGLESKASELDLKNYTINPFDDVWVSECKKCGAEFTEYDYDNSENSVRNHLMSEHGIDDSHLGNTLYNQNESKASETQDDFDWLNEDDDRLTATMWEQSDGTWIVNSEGSQFDSSFTTRFTDSVDAQIYMDKVNRGELTKQDVYNDEMGGYRSLEAKASETQLMREVNDGFEFSVIDHGSFGMHSPDVKFLEVAIFTPNGNSQSQGYMTQEKVDNLFSVFKRDPLEAFRSIGGE